LDKTKFEDKMIPGAETEQLTPEEVRWLRGFVAQRQGQWPRTASLHDAVAGSGTHITIAKTKEHEAAAVAYDKAQSALEAAHRQTYLETQAYLNDPKTGPNMPHTDPNWRFVPSSQYLVEEAEANCTSARVRLNHQEAKAKDAWMREYRRQNGIADNSTAGLIARGKAALGLD